MILEKRMKLVYVFTGLAVAVATVGCAQNKGIDTNVQTANSNAVAVGNTGTAATNIRMPNVSGSIWIRQKVALPPDAVLTVTLSDASQADAPSKIIAQRAVLTAGKQAPFSFVLPFDPAQVQPKARILLSAAITMKDKLAFVTDSVQPVVNNGSTKVDLTLVPVAHTALPMQQGGGAATTVPATSPTQITPSSAVPAPQSY